MNKVAPEPVRASTMAKAASTAPLMNHFLPSSSHWSPRRWAPVCSIAGGGPAPGGGVGHGKKGAKRALHQRVQVALLLRRCAQLLQADHVGLVRRCAVGGDGAQEAAAQL